MSNFTGVCPTEAAVDAPDGATIYNNTSLAVYFSFEVLTGVCSLFASLASVYLMVRHFQYYYQPLYQRYIVRVLLMVPIYSLTSWLSFMYVNEEVYFNVVRDCYEAFTLHSFFMLLMNFLGKDEETRRQTMQKFPNQGHPWPFGWVKFNPRGRAFMLASRQLILQYVVVRPMTTIASLLLELGGVLCYNSMSPSYGEFYISIINLTSVCVAMYVLVLFYLVIHHEISEHGPLLKFIAIKFVVFFSFWQGIVISGLSSIGLIKGNDIFNTSEMTSLILAALVCAEMLIAAVLHMRAFDYKVYIPPNKNMMPIKFGLKDSLNPIDILNEIGEAPKQVNEHTRYRREKRLRKKRNLNIQPIPASESMADMNPIINAGVGLHPEEEEEEEDDDNEEELEISYATLQQPFD